MQKEEIAEDKLEEKERCPMCGAEFTEDNPMCKKCKRCSKCCECGEV